MKAMPIAVLFAAMLAVTVTACTKNSDRCCDRYDDEYRVLWDGGDCHHRHWHASRHGEFFDPIDFGRGHDSLYGNPRNWHDENYSRFRESDRCRCRSDRHERGSHRWSRYNEDAVSERYAPPVAPDTEYDD